jgi:predicted nucleotidyltransferase
MSPRDAVAILDRRFAEKAAEDERCAREIRASIPVVAELLSMEFGVHKVVLFGSLTRGDARPDSDIDLAVEGLPPGQTFRAMARAAEAAGRHVDLVPIEGARPEVLAIIEREGEVILGNQRPAGTGSPRAA